MPAKRAIGITGVVLAALVLLVRYTPVLDPDLKIAPGMTELAAQFHAGGGPCLRYHAGSPNPGEVGMAATMLVQVELSGEDLGGLVGELYARARTEELPHHALAEEDEWIEAIRAGSSPLTRLALNLKKDRLRAVLIELLKTDVPKRKLLSELTEPQRKTLEKLWQRDPTLFLVSGLLPLIKKMRAFETRDRLNLIAAELTARVKDGAVPQTLEELGLDPRVIRDGWDREIEYEKQEGALVITSVGNDDEKPETRRVVLPSTMPALPQATGCTPPGEVTLKRKEFDDAISNPNSLALAARVVPAIKDGQVQGYKLFAIRPESLFARVGLCNGDTVKAVNGRPLTDAQKSLEVYDLVRRANEVDLAVERAGADVSIKVHVR